MSFNIGDKVTILPPFKIHFPNTYTILALSQADINTYIVDIYNDGIGSDFSDIYLEAA